MNTNPDSQKAALPSVYQYNQQSWDHAAQQQQRWSTPVTPEQVQQARDGQVNIVLTPVKLIPPQWLGDLKGKQVLLLAGSGGQQAPLVAAAGADVTVYDLSAQQLALDQMVAQREGLTLTTLQGSMDHLDQLQDEQFDLIIHPCSNTFVADVKPVWREAARVLKPGGELLSGFLNPLYFLFDEKKLKDGQFEVRYRVPYSDVDQRSQQQIQDWKDQWEPLCYGHTLEDQIGGQLKAGLVLIDMYEDGWGPGECEALDQVIPSLMATRSRKVTWNQVF